MRDIGHRIARHRLTRYAVPHDPVRHRLRWIWPALALWLLWVTLLSDHSFYRLWRLQEEQRRTRDEIGRVRADIRTLEHERDDPAAKQHRAEAEVRDAGMARPGEYIYRIPDAADSTRR
jgi:cell division protein FtsB